MAITFKKDAPPVGSFFKAVSDWAFSMANELNSQGVTFEVQMFAIKATLPEGKPPMMQALPASSSAIISKEVGMKIKGEVSKCVASFLTKVEVAVTGKPAHVPPEAIYMGIDLATGKDASSTVKMTGVVSGHLGFNEPPLQTITKQDPPKLHFGDDGSPIIEDEVAVVKEPDDLAKEIGGKALSPIKAAKMLLDSLKKFDPDVYKSIILEKAQEILPASSLVSGKPPQWKKGTFGTPIALKDATMLNQPVKSSSAGSVYRVVGIGERAKVATRCKGEQLSIRVEGNLTLAERAAFVELGFNDSGPYLSAHFKCGDCPPERVIAAVFFHPSLDFKYKIKSLAEVDSGL